MDVRFDMRELDDLERRLAMAPAEIGDRLRRRIDAETAAVTAAARATASSFRRKSTGTLLSKIGDYRFDDGLTGRVFIPARQAYFLEVGSPTTGGPRDFVSGPAGRAQEIIIGSLQQDLNPWQ